MSGRTFVLVLFLGLLPLAAAQAMSKLMIEQAWTRATLGPATAAVFLRIENHGSENDRLIGAESDIAERAELHRQVRDGDIVRSIPVDAVPVPPGGTVTLAPDSYAIMLFGLDRALRVGSRFEIALKFEHSGTVPVSVRVEPLGSPGPTAAFAPKGVQGLGVHATLR